MVDRIRDLIERFPEVEGLRMWRNAVEEELLTKLEGYQPV